jgi:hypothetical protein
MAVASGAMIGVFLVLIDQTPDDSGLVPLIANRVVNASIMLAVLVGLALVARRRGTAPRPRPRFSRPRLNDPCPGRGIERSQKLGRILLPGQGRGGVAG